MTIFISVASYRDEELEKTVRSLYDNASDKNSLVFGIVNQNERGKFSDFDWLGDQVRLYNMHYKDAKGAGYARKVAQELYGGEDFYFQVDSHMRFVEGWDDKLIGMHHWAREHEGTPNIILSQFPAPYLAGSDGKDYPIVDDPDFWDEPSWTSVVNTWTSVWAGNREKMPNFDYPHKSHTVLGALLFSHCKIVKDIPYDERISFMGEELCFAIRAYTRGYEIYAPNEMVATHFYKRRERPKIWLDNIAGRSWTDIEMESQRVQKRVLLGIEDGIYGIGDYQKYLDYQEMVGYNFEKFYEEDMGFKVNMGLITQEIEFDENFQLIQISKTGYCLNGFHSKCLAKEICDCKCHEGTLDE